MLNVCEVSGGGDGKSGRDSDEDSVRELAQKVRVKVKRAEVTGKDAVSSDDDEDFGRVICTV